MLHLSMWWNFRVTLDFPFTTWRQVTTNWGLTATPEPQRWPLSTRQTMGCSTAAGWSPAADIWSRASPGRSHSSQIRASTFRQRMMFLKITWMEQTRERPIHSVAFHPKGDTMTPTSLTSLGLFIRNRPPPSLPGRHLASVRMTALSSPLRLLMMPRLRVPMNRSRQREPNGEPHATTGSPFWRDALLWQGVALTSEDSPSTTLVLRTANQLRNWASLANSSSSSPVWKRHWSTSWNTDWKACWNSWQFTNRSNSAGTSRCGADWALRPPRAEPLQAGRFSRMLSRLLKLRGDRKPQSDCGGPVSVIKRENGRPLHITVPVCGWTTTPLQLIGVLVEKASDSVTTQQHLSTSRSSIPLAGAL